MKIHSSAFEINGKIPKKYTCDGENINPSLEIMDIPEKTKSLALIVDDPDAPSGTFTHWILWNISLTNKIEENSEPGIQGTNDFNIKEYKGPCPPTGDDHRYYFKLYALDKELSIEEGAEREKVIAELEDHVIESCNTMGRYKKE